MKIELGKFKTKQEQDIDALQLKMTQAYNEFKKKRAIELDTLIQKHKNKLKDLELNHKNELVDWNRLKTNSKMLGGNASNFMSRPISRMGSKISSAPVSPYGGGNTAGNTFTPFKLSGNKFFNKKKI